MSTIPENYEKLGKAGFTPKSAWSATETYNRLDIVYHKGSSYIVVNDGVTGVTPSETDQNYIIMAAGQEKEETLIDDLHNVDMLGKFTRVVDYGIDTENTPYTAGKTNCTGGTAIISGDADNWCTIVAISCSANEIFLCSKSQETAWSEWIKVSANVTDPLCYRGLMDGDLNDTTITPGYYTIANNQGNGLPDNLPIELDNMYGTFIQFPGSPFMVQVLMGTMGMAIRQRTGNPANWNTWKVFQYTNSSGMINESGFTDPPSGT